MHATVYMFMIMIFTGICLVSCSDNPRGVSPPASSGSAAILNTPAERETNTELIGVAEREAEDDPELKVHF